MPGREDPGASAVRDRARARPGLVARALASALPVAWMTADAAYGQECRFRRVLEDAGVGYVLTVPKSKRVTS